MIMFSQKASDTMSCLQVGRLSEGCGMGEGLHPAAEELGTGKGGITPQGLPPPGAQWVKEPLVVSPPISRQ